MTTLSRRRGLLRQLSLAVMFTIGLGLLAGCASTPKVDWNSRVGAFTIDQAIVELGPPDKSAKLDDGSAVADWFIRKKSNVSFSFGVGSYGSHGGVGVGQTVSPSSGYQTLRLIFGPDGQLKSWSRN